MHRRSAVKMSFNPGLHQTFHFLRPFFVQVFVLEGILGLLNAQRDLTGGLGGEVANIESDLGQFAGLSVISIILAFLAVNSNFPQLAGVAKFLCELVEANSGIDCP